MCVSNAFCLVCIFSSFFFGSSFILRSWSLNEIVNELTTKTTFHVDPSVWGFILLNPTHCRQGASFSSLFTRLRRSYVGVIHRSVCLTLMSLASSWLSPTLSSSPPFVTPHLLAGLPREGTVVYWSVQPSTQGIQQLIISYLVILWFGTSGFMMGMYGYDGLMDEMTVSCSATKYPHTTYTSFFD